MTVWMLQGNDPRTANRVVFPTSRVSRFGHVATMSTMNSSHAPPMVRWVIKGSDQGTRPVCLWYCMGTPVIPDVAVNLISSLVTCAGNEESRKLSKRSLYPQLAYSMDTRRKFGRYERVSIVYRVLESIVPSLSCSPNGTINIGCCPAALPWVSRVKLSELQRRSDSVWERSV
jgi:hypothetical protein